MGARGAKIDLALSNHRIKNLLAFGVDKRLSRLIQIGRLVSQALLLSLQAHQKHVIGATLAQLFVPLVHLHHFKLA